ncbi:helix-turn-helix domain-containing protein [Chryseobacterium ginsengisoli]|uniref:helix-turn-helix domain-containing protein n=1 Tax=Chryseobacterium ginsengisoli TaxID=363853 RepID=UPI0031EE29F0
MMKNNSEQLVEASPDYKRIYSDMIDLKYPEKKQICNHLLLKNTLSTLDIIEISRILFDESSTENSEFNQRHRSYNKSTIFQILEYQKKHNLNNSQLAKHFKLSRNTINKWKTQFLI